MKKVNVPRDQIEQFEGMWVAIDHKRNRIIAVGKTLREIASYVTGKVGQEDKIKASAFLVPRKDECPYVFFKNFQITFDEKNLLVNLK